MKLIIDNKTYDIVITYKNNKNMYLRVKDDLKIYITAPVYISNKTINNFIEDNIDSIKKMIKRNEEKLEKNNNKVLYLGKKYDICYINDKNIYFGDNKVFINKDYDIDKFYKKQSKIIFYEEFMKCLDSFKEIDYIPLLKIRKMTSKWGVCNVTKRIITLNLDLIKLDVKYLDYVIYHELSHLIYPNHSKDFWALVKVYVPNYKTYKKEMNE